MEILKDSETLRYITKQLIDIAQRATCKRSKCGSIIVTGDMGIIGAGYNSMPCNEVAECFKDNLAPTFKSDRTCCIHAEQRAIMDAMKGRWRDQLKGSTLYFIRLDENDKPTHAGKPYCSICSKMALDTGISKFVLWHEQGWTSYDTKEYNELTFQYSDAKEDKKDREVAVCERCKFEKECRFKAENINHNCKYFISQTDH